MACKTLLVEKSDLGSGTSGRYHGLLHSGGRYVVTDPAAAHECIVENAIVRRIAPACVEDTGGYFVATPEDPDDFGDAFAAACAASSVPVDEVSTAAVRAREPALNPALKRAFRVRDAVVEPWQLIEANVVDGRSRGGDALAVPPGRRDAAVRRPDPRGRRRRRARRERSAPSHPRIVVSAAGAWAGRVAALAGAELAMSPGKGTMLIFNQRMTDTVVNRSSDRATATSWSRSTRVAILGTTEEEVDDPDVYGIRREEVAALLAEGEKLFPDLPRMRLLRAYAGVRPLYSAEPSAGGGGRRPGDLAGPRRDRPRAARRRRQPRLDRRRQADDLPAHGEADGRRRRPQARAGRALHDRRGGPARPGRRADVLAGPPARGARGRRRWRRRPRLRVRARHADGGSTRSSTSAGRARSTTSGAARGWGWVRARAGSARSGPRGSSRSVRSRATRRSRTARSTTTLGDFLAERFRGTRPIAWGRQLQELWLTSGLYTGVLGVESLPGADIAAGGAPSRCAGPTMPTVDVVVIGAGLAGMTAALGARRGRRAASRSSLAATPPPTGRRAGSTSPRRPAPPARPRASRRCAAVPGHPYALLADDVAVATDRLRGWLAAEGVTFVGDLASPIRPVPTSIGGDAAGRDPAERAGGRTAPRGRPDERLVILGFRGFKDFWPDAIAASLTRPAVWDAPGEWAVDPACGRTRRVAGGRAARPRRPPQRDGADHRRGCSTTPSRGASRSTRSPRPSSGPANRSRAGRACPAAIGLQATTPRRSPQLAAAIAADAVRDPARSAEPSRAAPVRGAPVGAAGEGRPDHGRRAGRGGDAGRTPGDGRVDAGGGRAMRTIRTGGVVLATGGIAGGGLVGHGRRATRRGRLRACRWRHRRSTTGWPPTPFDRRTGIRSSAAGIRTDAALRPVDPRGQGRARERRDRGQPAGRAALPRASGAATASRSPAGSGRRTRSVDRWAGRPRTGPPGSATGAPRLRAAAGTDVAMTIQELVAEASAFEVGLSADDCLKCNVCNTVCPVARVTDLFPGPKYVGPQAQRFRLATLAAARRAEPSRTSRRPDATVDWCSGCGMCTMACPADVKIAEMNNRARAQLRAGHRPRFRDWLLGQTDLVGRLGVADRAARQLVAPQPPVPGAHRARRRDPPARAAARRSPAGRSDPAWRPSAGASGATLTTPEPPPDRAVVLLPRLRGELLRARTSRSPRSTSSDATASRRSCPSRSAAACR